MSDPVPSSNPSHKKSLLERISHLLLREPEDREQLQEILQQAHERHLLDADALSMIEGVMQVDNLTARDIMVPRAQMDMLDIQAEMADILNFAVEKAHSRFPVYEGSRDQVIGVLLAKDLLKILQGRIPDLRAMLRPAVFIPETKKLNHLLHDFRVNRNHIALVVDEYGGVSGLITIEDVLEQIVGDIEDEYDFDEVEDHILPLQGNYAGQYRVKAITDLPQFESVFGVQFDCQNSHTVGGLLIEHLGRVPRRGERLHLEGLQFEVLRANARQIHLLRVRRLDAGASLEQQPRLKVANGSNG